MNSVEISEYFNTSYCDYSSYDNFRKIASMVDGNKISNRKCLYVILKDNIKNPVKVQNFISEVAKRTNYVHGASSLYGVTVGMAQDFAGTNNIPLLKRKGAFGTRTIPDAAADRYIFTCMEDIIPKIFMSEDMPNLQEQIFEGDVIEPKCYIPVIPMLLVNGAIGLTTGFSQKILSRDPKELIKWIKAKLSNKKFSGKLLPYFNGFKGSVVENDTEGSYTIYGAFQKVSGNKVEINDIPIGYDLQSYLKVLDKLIDQKKIKDYEDLSEGNEFHIIVTFWRNQGLDIGKCDIMQELKLSKSVTESYTSLNEDNKVVEYKSTEELLEAFYKVRYEYYQKRIAYQIKKITDTLILNASKYAFIKGIIDETIVINNKSDEAIIAQLDKIELIKKVNNSYDYLLNIPCSQLTKEKYQKLKEQLKEDKQKLQEAKKVTVEELWNHDLDEILKNLK